MANEKIPRLASDFQTQLSGAISVGATSFTIQSATDNSNVLLSDGIYTFTIDRDNNSRKEYLLGQLTAATKTVSSISSVSAQGVLTANAQKAHRIGANVIISDHSILSSISNIFNGIGTIDPASPLQYTTAPTLSSATQIATKGYVDSVVTGGTVNTDRIIVGSQTAGETLVTSNIVYFKSSDSRWYKADADLPATFQNVQLGVALGAGTAGNPISGGVQIYGKCDSFTGLTATATYYLSNTAGAVSTSAGTFEVVLGQAFNTTGIFFNPETKVVPLFVSTSAGAADSGKGVTLNLDGYIDSTLNFSNVQEFTSSGTWNKPSLGTYAVIELLGAGGSGGSASFNNGSARATARGGAGGAYSKYTVSLSFLSATESVSIGAGGAAVTTNNSNSDGNVGGTTSIATYFTALGGAGGTRAINAGAPTPSSLDAVGGLANTVSDQGFNGANSNSSNVYSAGGGSVTLLIGGSDATAAGGTSLFGFNAGTAVGKQNAPSITATNGQRACGGGAAVVVSSGLSYVATSGAGGNGYAKITVY